jgi:hypothetical protein
MYLNPRITSSDIRMERYVQAELSHATIPVTRNVETA